MKFTVLESSRRSHEFVFTRDKLGQEVLDTVCEELGVKEKNYFGLKYHVNDTSLWLNLRNPVLTQLRPHLTGKHHRLRLEVKFFVDPQELQQEVTRQHFYFCLKTQIFDGKFTFTSEQAVKLCSLMAQAEYGDYQSGTQRFLEFKSSCLKEIIADEELAKAHASLKGTARKTARDTFLNEIAKEELYDAEIFKAKAGGQKVAVAVCSSGLKVFDRKSPGHLKQKITFENIAKMNLSEDRLIIVTKRSFEESRYNFIHFFLSNGEGAKAMHKAILEHQLFFYSSKVRKSVIDHYLLSMPCWALPAKWFTKIPAKELYHLDVKLTRRQSYDYHYGKLMDSAEKEVKHDWFPMCAKCKVEESNTLFCPCGHILLCSKCAEGEVFCPLCKEAVTGSQKVFYAMDTESNDWTCQICMDNTVNTVFCPCGHMYCCEECASNLICCPLCKTFATYVQRVHVAFPQEEEPDGSVC